MDSPTPLSSSNSRRRFAVAATLAAAMMLALGGWWWRTRDPIRRQPGLNVLLITIDTLRADALGAYGRAGSPTPSIDRLAGSGALFTNAHAHNVLTLPSHANILTGRLPTNHGVRDNAGFRLPDSVKTLATVLRKEGYRTGAFVSAFPLDKRFGLAQGFDLYDDRFVGAGARPAFLIQERSAERTIALARQWLEANRDERWFCWVHLYEPHYPYEPPPAVASRWPTEPYIAEVAAADAALAPLLDSILAAGEEGRTLVVLTSDHGESLGEHGEATHGIFGYEAALKVPLILYQPTVFPSRAVDSPAGHADIFPTVLDALAMPVPDGLAGRSLLPAAAGAGQDRLPPLYFEALSGALNRGWAPLTGVIAEGFKYIDLPVPELYDLSADPYEQRNLASSDPHRTTALRTMLTGFREGAQAAEARRQIPSEVRERLRSLGYVSGRAAHVGPYSEDDDPKRLIALDRLLQDVLELYLDGDLAGAIARCQELVRRRPGMALSWMHLAHLQREAGDLPGAIGALQRASSLSPNDDEALVLLGAYLTEAGRAREAADLLDAPSRQPHPSIDLLSTRALALSSMGRTEDALAAIARARAIDPSNAMVLVHAGTVQLSGGNRVAATQAFEEAIRLNPDVARAHTSLGVLALEEGRPDRAAAHWQAATSIDPREHEKILTLGIALARGGRTAEARTAFAFFAEHAPESSYSRQRERARAWLAANR